MGDLRKHNRLPFSGKISLTWADTNGNPFGRNGDCLDVSSTGLKIKLDSQIAVRTVVTVKAKELALHGSASVRSCTRLGSRFVLGLEFVGGMKWQIPAALLTPVGQ